jgi:hypothetical protein
MGSPHAFGGGNSFVALAQTIIPRAMQRNAR